jgi:hypothetical protein
MMEPDNHDSEERLASALKNAAGEIPLSPILAPQSPSHSDISSLRYLQLPQLVGSWWRGQLHCPFCLTLVETTLIGLSTQLGPSFLQCRKCNQLLLSHRRDWSDGNGIAKAWYVTLSLFYTAVCAVLASLCTGFACWAAHVAVGWTAVFAALLCGFAIVSLQVVRVVRSLSRARSAGRMPVRPSFWCLDYYLPQKVLAATFLSTVALGAILKFIVNP